MMEGWLISAGSSTKNEQKSLSRTTKNQVLALAALLQQHLGIIVTPCLFYPAGKRPLSRSPCSLVSIEPFVPGGLRRLVLNAHHPLIQRMAHAYADGYNVAVILRMGATMATTATWPIAQLEGVPANIAWSMSKDLLCGPQQAFVWPVPHERVNKNGQSALPLETIAIWPRRIHGYRLQTSRQDIQQVKECIVARVQEKWQLRDEALWNEWEYCLQQQQRQQRLENGTTSKIMSKWKWVRPKNMRGASKDRPQETITTKKNKKTTSDELALLTYSPSFPLLAMAYAVHSQNNNVSLTACLPTAGRLLLEHDRLFAFSIFFGVPLVDRTGILSSSQTLKCIACVPPPPAKAEVDAYQDYIRSHLVDADNNNLPIQEEEKKSDVKDFPVHKALGISMIHRAETLWKESEGSNPPLDIVVAWSGGIDSTSALVALIKTSNPTRKSRLGILYSDESLLEHPRFYQQIVEMLPQIKLYKKGDDEKLSTCAVRRFKEKALIVTGELGDQLFGSDRCARAFPEETAVLDATSTIPTEVSKALSAAIEQQDEVDAAFSKGLEQPWEDVILTALDTLHLLGGDKQAWKAWIQPQLELAPVPIVTTFDFLWWINFSLKWQNVMLRCTHDGGTPLLPTENQPKFQRRSIVANHQSLTGSIRHFYNDRGLECWSSVPSCHYSKFGNLSRWSSYKEPLKAFLLDFDGDKEYYETKTKVASLNFGFSVEDPTRYSDRMLGIVVDVEDTEEKGARVCENARMLAFGACSIGEPDGDDADDWESLLQPWVLSAASTFPRSANTGSLSINPWKNPPLQPSPFDVASYFASDDERQRRRFNPVTKVTLEGKCAAMFPTEILKDASALDLGACLGAACYYALCCGAKHVVGVEVQQNFCDRAKDMLDRAVADRATEKVKVAQDSEECSSEKAKPASYEFICSGVREYLENCQDGSFDTVVGMGLLHCFTDPITILVEMCRVASRAVMLEITHAAVNSTGVLPDPDGNYQYHSQPSLATHVQNNHFTQNYIMELAPSALVNASASDASFQGMSCLMSRQLVETVVQSLGFQVTRVTLEEHPTMDTDVRTYTGPAKFASLSSRYFLRCVRGSEGNIPRSLTTLEEAVVTDKRSYLHSWSKQPRWLSFEGQKNLANATKEQKDEVAKKNAGIVELATWVPGSASTPWVFDDSVAERFEREARCHIPEYEEVVNACIDLLELEVEKTTSGAVSGPSESITKNKPDFKVVDIGCATGYTMIQLLCRGFRNVHGVDVSAAMLERAKSQLQSHSILKDKLQEDFVETNFHNSSTQPLYVPKTLREAKSTTGESMKQTEPFHLDAVLLNWTLHFVPNADDRKLFLIRIAKEMKPGSLLILTEKTQQSPETKKAYYDWKRSRGVTTAEIVEKEGKLRGVLEPFPIVWYLRVLQEACGFSDVSILSAKYSFVTFVARRDHRGLVAPAECQVDPQQDSFINWPNLSENATNVHFTAAGEFQMKAWSSGNGVWEGGEDECSIFGFVYEGETTLKKADGKVFRLYPGMYFACPGCVTLEGGSGIVVIAPKHKCQFTIGGPVASGDEGRLPYIDGCSDSLLVSPVLRGDPCLNHLHFPGGIKQTKHTHPSGRAGLVIGGKGVCVYRKQEPSSAQENSSEDIRTDLLPGCAFDNTKRCSSCI